MARTTLTPEARRAQILNVAAGLFQARGFAVTSVDEIVRAAGVAKGTFYYYYRTKQDILADLASLLVEHLAEGCRTVANDPGLGALDKLRAIIGLLGRSPDAGVVEDLHRPENRELHERSNVEVVLRLGPIVADVVEQGCRGEVFRVEDPLSTVQFVLAGSLFLFGDGVFRWTPDAWRARQRAMLRLIERALGAEDGALEGALPGGPRS